MPALFSSVYCATIIVSATRSAGNRGPNRARAGRESERERPLVAINIQPRLSKLSSNDASYNY